MVDVSNKRCPPRDYKSYQDVGFASAPAPSVYEERKDVPSLGMMIGITKCGVAQCEGLAQWGLEGGKPILCGDHGGRYGYVQLVGLDRGSKRSASSMPSSSSPALSSSSWSTSSLSSSSPSLSLSISSSADSRQDFDRRDAPPAPKRLRQGPAASHKQKLWSHHEVSETGARFQYHGEAVV